MEETTQIDPLSRMAPQEMPNGKKPPRQAPAPRGQLESVIPPYEAAKIYKVDDEGKEGIINTYSPKEILQYGGDLELFVRKKLVPSYGAGDYSIVYVKGSSEVRGKMIRVQPPEKNDDSQTMLAIKMLQEQNETMRAQLMAAQSAPQVPSFAPSPSMDPMMLMFMNQQQSAQQAAMQAISSQFTQALSDIKGELREVKSQPKSEWSIEKVMMLVSTLGAPAFAFIKQWMDSSKAEREKLEKKIEKMMESTSDPIEELERLDQYVQRRHARLYPQDGVSETANASGLPAIVKSVENIMNVAEKLRGPTRQAPRPQAKVEVTKVEPKPAELPAASAPVQASAPVTEVTEEAEAEIEAICERLEKASTIADRGMAVIDLLRFMNRSGDAEAKKQIARVLKMAKRGDKDITIKFLKENFDGLREAGLLSGPTIDATLAELSENFDVAKSLLPESFD